MPNDYTLLKHSGMELDLDLAVFLAHASQIVYDPEISIRNWAMKHGFTECTFIDRNNIQAFWCVGDDVALLCFRGTSNTGQWIRDLRLIPIDHPWGNVHAGFSKGFKSVEGDLLKFLANAKRLKHVWITGHSLGGALGVLAAAWLRMKGVRSRIYTYGQPRVGLGEFANMVNKQFPGHYIRFVNQSDIVPRVPPGLLYRHSGIVKHITGSGGLEAITQLEDTELEPLTEAEFEQLQDTLNQPVGENFEGITDIFSDHKMTEYIRMLTMIRG
jgi:hypothetical protein